MLNYTGRVGYILDDYMMGLNPPSNLITGVGRMKYRKPDKVEANHKRKKKASRAMAKRSRRRQRG